MKACSALFLLLVLCVAAQAETLRVPTDYSTIQAAIDAAANGDTVNIAEGRYREALILTKSITLTGDGVDRTLISHLSLEPIILVSDCTVVIENLSIAKAVVSDFAQIGVGIIENASVRASKCSIEIRSATAMHVSEGSTLDLERTEISGSHTAMRVSGHVSATSCQFTDNDTSVDLRDGSGSFQDCGFVGSMCAIALDKQSTASFDRCAFRENSIALQATYGAVVSGSDNAFSGNRTHIQGSTPTGFRTTSSAGHEPEITFPSEKYDTLGAAIHALVPGGVLRLQTGSTTSLLTIDKPITIRATGTPRPMLLPTEPYDPVIFSVVSGGDLRLDGIAFTGRCPIIEVHGLGNLDMRQCLLKATGGWGSTHAVEINDAGNASFVECTINLDGSTTIGIETSDEAMLWIEDCEILGSSTYGILAKDRSFVDGVNNRLTGDNILLQGNIAGSVRSARHEARTADTIFPGEDLASLQEAIDSTEEGGTLTLTPGVHWGSATIGKRITIRAASSDDPAILRPPLMSPSIILSLVTGADVLLDGVHFAGDGTKIIASGGANLQMVGCAVSGTGDGVLVAGLASAEVSGCEFLEVTGDALRVEENGILQVDESTFRTCATGIRGHDDAAAVVARCFFDGADRGIFFWGTGNLSIEDTEFRGNEDAIRCYDLAKFMLADTIIRSEVAHSVFVEARDVRLSDCSFLQDEDVQPSDSSNVYVPSLVSVEADSAVIRGCSFRATAFHALSVAASLASIDGCCISSTYGTGLRILEPQGSQTEFSVTATRIADCSVGVDIDGRARGRLDGCSIVDNTSCGVRAGGNAVIDGTGNDFANNARDTRCLSAFQHGDFEPMPGNLAELTLETPDQMSLDEALPRLQPGGTLWLGNGTYSCSAPVLHDLTIRALPNTVPHIHTTSDIDGPLTIGATARLQLQGVDICGGCSDSDTPGPPSPLTGIACVAEARVELSECLITNWFIGISLQDRSIADLEECAFTLNQLNGCRMEGSASAIFRQCFLSRHKGLSWSAALLAMEEANASLYECELADNNYALLLLGSGSLTMRNTGVLDSAFGIVHYPAAFPHIDRMPYLGGSIDGSFNTFTDNQVDCMPSIDHRLWPPGFFSSD